MGVSRLKANLTGDLPMTVSAPYQEFPVATTFGLEVPAKVMALGFADASNPHIPAKSDGYAFRRVFLRELLAFLRDPSGDALYVTGPTGSGKTSGICEVAARLNWPVQQVTCHGRMEVTDLIGHHTLMSRVPGETPVMTFQHGPLAVAMREGHILLLNEVDMMDPGELSGLNDVLEGRPLVIPQNAGEVIKPHPMFRVVVTGNSVGNGDATGLYQGIAMQNLAAMDRYRIVEVDYAKPEVEAKILAAVAGRLPENLRDRMISVANEIRRLFKGEEGMGGEIAITMSTRTLVRWAKLSIRFHKAVNPQGERNALAYALDQALLRRARPEEKEAIVRIASDTFGDQWVDGDQGDD
ncbi:CbbQ/NirQ/NorQ/GpvN family protein [Halomonas sp. LBP4]|nr:CbbQ/NirQ/NorQ/GpvN family protein [Halomonas sp. LBP4]